MLCKKPGSFTENIHTLKHIVLLCFLWISYPGFCQDYFFDNYSVAEGISQSTVFDIYQDHFDYIWLGTREGTSRFDGREFLNFSLQDGMAGNGVRIIYEDCSNKIWFGHSGGGISVFDGREFHVFSSPGNFFNSDITGITEDEDNNLWISSELSGAVKFSLVGDSLENSEYELYIGNDLSDRVFGMYKRKNGTLCFITDAFLKTFNPENNLFESFYIEGMPTYFLITCMFEDDKENLWFGTYNGGIYHYNTSTSTFRVYDIRDGLASNWITTISEDNKGALWIGTWGGGISVLENGKFRLMNNTNGLQDLKIRKILEDREGNLVIGTNENGISIFKGYQFVNYFPEHGLRDPQVWSLIHTSDSNFWIGTSKGISIFNPNTPYGEKFTNFNKLTNNRILFLRQDIHKRIWIGTDKEGVFTYNQENHDFTYDPYLNTYILNKSNVVTALETDKQGNIWTGLLDGLVCYNFDSKELNYYTQSSGLSGNEITALHNSPTGVTWIGSRGYGLDFYQNDSIIHLNLNEKFTPVCIQSDLQGYLWVGTESRGLLQIDIEKSCIVKNLKQKDGLLANLINSLAVDNKNQIYIGTNQGLNMYDPSADKINAFSHKNGFVGIETKPGAVCMDPEDKLWFGTIKGITRFDPSLLRKNNMDPLTHIISFRVNLEERDLSSPAVLSHLENDIVFKYISVCLTNPEAVAYRIMLEGADNDWRPVTNQTMVTYPALSPGYYSFKVTGRNNEGIWNPEPVCYNFQIKPPLYRTTGFIIICIILGISIIILYIKIREKNLIREKQILEEKVADRTKEVVSQKELLARKNKNITDSIRYAKRIQIAVMPQTIPFRDTFILFKPKDIVSGDFYWLETVGDREFHAAVDCTGHGVPGAFMSIIGANLLNKIVKEYKIFQPSLILDRLNLEVVKNLRTSREGDVIYDGMDLSLVSYDRSASTIEYSGAFNSIVLVKGGKMEEIKADRDSIGRSLIAGSTKHFTNHRRDVSSGDVIYLYSDGYADQFGGERGKKFKSAPLKKLLVEISNKSMEEQKAILEKEFLSWKGDMEQIDDILIIGRRL